MVVEVTAEAYTMLNFPSTAVQVLLWKFGHDKIYQFTLKKLGGKISLSDENMHKGY